MYRNGSMYDVIKSRQMDFEQPARDARLLKEARQAEADASPEKKASSPRKLRLPRFLRPAQVSRG